MAEVTKPVQMVQVTWICDECGEEMTATGSVCLPLNPPKYPHKCSGGHVVNLFETYPRLRPELIEEG